MFKLQSDWKLILCSIFDIISGVKGLFIAKIFVTYIWKLVFRNLFLILIFSMFPFYSFFNLFIEKSLVMYFSSKRIMTVNCIKIMCRKNLDFFMINDTATAKIHAQLSI